MANINDMVFIIQFLVLIAIFLYQMWNIMHMGKIYSIKITFLLIIGLTVAWFMGLQVIMLEYSKAIYSILFQLESIFFVLGWLFLFFEVIFALMEKAQQIIKKPFNSMETKKSLKGG